MNLEADGSGFCVNIGVLGADPRRHAFSYDVSAKSENGKVEKLRFDSIHHKNISKKCRRLLTTELNGFHSIVVWA